MLIRIGIRLRYYWASHPTSSASFHLMSKRNSDSEARRSTSAYQASWYADFPFDKKNTFMERIFELNGLGCACTLILSMVQGVDTWRVGSINRSFVSTLRHK